MSFEKLSKSDLIGWEYNMAGNYNRNYYNKMIKSDLHSLMKNTRTKDFLLVLAKFSLNMWKADKPLDTIELNNLSFHLYLFQIHYLAYYSIKNGNDHKNRDNAENHNHTLTAFIAANKLINLPEIHVSKENIWTTLACQTAEQLSLQEFSWILPAINRMQHLLRFYGKETENLNEILKHFFNCSLQEYWQVLLLIFLINTESIFPLQVFVDSKFEERCPDSFLKYENFVKILDYFSCTYDDVRKNDLGPQIFYTKPFIKFEDGEYLCINQRLFQILLFNSFYYLSIDYHSIKNKSFGIFGYWFEKYIEDIVAHYQPNAIIYSIPRSNEKSADYILRIGNYIFLIESKSAPMHIMSKRQQPNEESLHTYIIRNVIRAYSQLNQSLDKEFKENEKERVVKIILSGENSPSVDNIFIKGACHETCSVPDEKINSDEKLIAKNFALDTRALFVTIREFEILLNLTVDNFNHVMEHVLENKCQQSILQTILELKPEISEDTFFTGNLDYFQRAIEYLKPVLGV